MLICVAYSVDVTHAPNKAFIDLASLIQTSVTNDVTMFRDQQEPTQLDSFYDLRGQLFGDHSFCTKSLLDLQTFETISPNMSQARVTLYQLPNFGRSACEHVAERP